MRQLIGFVTTRLLYLTFLFLYLGTAAAQVVWTRTETDLLAQPKASSPTITRLMSGTQAVVQNRRGIWIEIQSNAVVGWVKLSDVRFKENANFKSSLAKLKTGREGSGNNVVTTGVRGLGSEALELARPDSEAVSKFKLVYSNIALKQELKNIKNPRPVEDIAYRPSSKPNKKALDKDSQRLESKSSPSLKVEDDF